MTLRAIATTAGLLLMTACNAGNGALEAPGVAAPAPLPDAASATPNQPFTVSTLARFDEPWAMTFLPDGRLLVTEKRGALKLFDPARNTTGTISGVPAVDYGGQGGLGDVVLHPDFARNALVYLSFVEAGDGDTRGAAVARGRLALAADGSGALSVMEIIWRQVPKVSGRGHYAHRLAFGPSGHLFITSGERQKFDPAQDMQSNLGKIVRIADDGALPSDNPFADQGGVAAQVWTLGHRNLLGIAFDAQGQLWSHEMGPRGGDEFNRIERGGNYGYPIVSDGDHYDGRDIPDHAMRQEFKAPLVTWTPVISPAGLVIYSGGRFADWKGNAIMGGLSGQALVRVAIDGNTAREAARYDMGHRIREVEQGPDGDLWLLEDGDDARLLKLSPAG